MTDDSELIPQQTRPRPWWRGVLRWVGEFAIYLIVALVVVSLVRSFLVQPFLVPSGSMEQTLQVNDTIVAWKPGEPQRGEIVVFRDDLGWLGPAPQAPGWKWALAWLRVLPPQDEQYLVKRLIGLPGDHVTCCDASGRVSVNGQALDESEYVFFGSASAAQRSFDVVVPEGRIFVMGDHRDNSADSRYHLCSGISPTPEEAFPTIDSIQGAVVAVVRPFSRATTFSVPETFAGVPEATASPPSASEAQWSCP